MDFPSAEWTTMLTSFPEQSRKALASLDTLGGYQHGRFAEINSENQHHVGTVIFPFTGAPLIPFGLYLFQVKNTVLIA